MTPIRCGVVGFGLSGRIFHSAVIDAVEGLTLAGIVQRTGSEAQQTYPRVPAFRDLDSLLTKGDVDVVVIATPNDTHAPLARQALEAGKHVVIDKPFTLTAHEAAQLTTLSRTHHHILTANQNRRWDGDFLTLQRLIADNTLGRIAVFESHFDRFRPRIKSGSWRETGRPGSGVLYDLAPHLIDQALVLFGKPEAVYADIRTERPGAHADDAFDLRLYYPQTTVWLRASCLAPLPPVRFALSGAKASYRKFGLDPQEDALRAGDFFQSHPWGMEPESAWGTLTTASNGVIETRPVPTEAGDYRNFYRNLRDAILGRAELAVPPVEAWRTMRLLEQAQESSRNRKIVTCDWSLEP